MVKKQHNEKTNYGDIAKSTVHKGLKPKIKLSFELWMVATQQEEITYVCGRDTGIPRQMVQHGLGWSDKEWALVS